MCNFVSLSKKRRCSCLLVVPELTKIASWGCLGTDSSCQTCSSTGLLLAGECRLWWCHRDHSRRICYLAICWSNSKFSCPPRWQEFRSKDQILVGKDAKVIFNRSRQSRFPVTWRASTACFASLYYLAVSCMTFQVYRSLLWRLI